MVANSKESVPPGVLILTLFLALLLLLSLAVVISVWPNIGIGPAEKLSAELRFLILVASGGALGSSVQALTRLTGKIGTRNFASGWRLTFLLQFFAGSPLAMIMYMAIRGGVLSTDAGAKDLNPYGILGLSALIGLFAAQLLGRLNSIAVSLFQNETALEKQIDKLGSALGVSTLDNYEGFACLRIEARGGLPVSSDDDDDDDETPILYVGGSYDLNVWFQRDKPESDLSGEIRITGGADRAEVEFGVASDSDGAGVRPRQQSTRFVVTESSPHVQFGISVLDTVGRHELWVEISQKNRLIHVISMDFIVQKG